MENYQGVALCQTVTLPVTFVFLRENTMTETTYRKKSLFVVLEGQEPITIVAEKRGKTQPVWEMGQQAESLHLEPQEAESKHTAS